MTPIKRRLALYAALAAVVLAGHAALLAVLAGKNVVAVILAAGPNAPKGTLALAGLFLFLRLLAVLLLPGMLLSGVGVTLFNWWADRRCGPVQPVRSETADQSDPVGEDS